MLFFVVSLSKKGGRSGGNGSSSHSSGSTTQRSGTSQYAAEQFAKERLEIAGFERLDAFDLYQRNGNRFRFAGWGTGRGENRKFDIIVSSESGHWEVLHVDIQLQ